MTLTTGEALLLLPEATAQQLLEPVQFAGGALVDERVPPDPAAVPGDGAALAPTAAPATPFTPGAESTSAAPAGGWRCGCRPTRPRGRSS